MYQMNICYCVSCDLLSFGFGLHSGRCGEDIVGYLVYDRVLSKLQNPRVQMQDVAMATCHIFVALKCLV